jgi:ADP-ribose pyrophosphatase
MQETRTNSVTPMSEILHEGRHLKLLRHAGWEFAERVRASGAAVIVAITNDDKLLLVEQFRVPVGRRVIELPAGLVGDDSASEQEGIAEAARRELFEETGYDARELKHVLTGPPSSGMSSELVSFVIAGDLKKHGTGGGVEGESIVVHEIPLSALGVWLKEQQCGGALLDPKIFAGLSLAGRTLQF